MRPSGTATRIDQSCPGWCRFQFVVQHDVRRFETLAAEDVDGLAVEAREAGVHVLHGDPVDRTGQEAHEVLADVGVQHADRAQGAGVPGDVGPFAAEAPRHRCAVHRARAAGRDQRETPGRVAAFYRDVLDGVEHVLFDEVNDAGRGLFDRECERLGDLRPDCRAGRLRGPGRACRPPTFRAAVGRARVARP